jgi:hypothetical protein
MLLEMYCQTIKSIINDGNVFKRKVLRTESVAGGAPSRAQVQGRVPIF